MPARKLKIELFDGEGNRYAITFEGRVTRDKATKILDLVDLLSGVPKSPAILSNNLKNMSIFERIKLLVENSFPFSWFKTRDIHSLYEEKYSPISISTISTYLTRMANRGFLINEREGHIKRFRINSEFFKLRSKLNY